MRTPAAGTGPDAPPEAPYDSSATRARSRRWRAALLLGGAAGAAVLGFTGYQALMAASALKGTADGFTQLQDDLVSGDRVAARATLAAVQDEAGLARSSTRGPVWWVASLMPGLGNDVAAIRTVSEVADGLAQRALPEVVATSEVLRPEQLKPQGGRIDLAPIAQAAPAVQRAATEIADQAAAAEGIRTSGLLPVLDGPVEDLKAKAERAASLVDRASRAVTLLPPMLGHDGPRRYLVMFQNNAESRATGGLVGSLAVITADDGGIEMSAQESADSVGRFAEPPTPLTDEERRLFGPGLGANPKNVTLTPDFPRSAELVATMYQTRTGRPVDGVVSADPVALSYLLEGTGPVSTSIGPDLTADTAVDLLLSGAYELPQRQQDPFFEETAATVFEAVASGQGDPRGVLDGLVRGATERRLLVWSGHTEEQRLIGPTRVSGALTDSHETTPDVGVFLNAAVPTKLDYYREQSTDLETLDCAGDRQRMRLTTTLTSRVDPEELAGLSNYVARDTVLYGRGSVVNLFYVLAPAGGTIEEVTLDGVPKPLARKQLDGHQVVTGAVVVAPGETRTLEVELTGGAGQTGDPVLRATPGARTDGIGRVAVSACAN